MFRLFYQRGLVCLLFILLFFGCDSTQLPTSTPEASPFASGEVVEPATLEEFLRVSNLREALEIEWHNPTTKSCITIRDQAFIQQFVDMMLMPQSTTPISANEATLLIFETNSLDQPADTRLIALNLDPAQATAAFNNLSTPNWPIDLQGQYQLGDPQALLDLLATIEPKSTTNGPVCE
ncbi:hypothetical protein [Herpetosiphon giganteus]|uniref:hypothetical protein n=1 Tax=Herpetosiphon giganteus TaxID=2029754 RepID=UPI00195CCA03|nr:hypothetical protein [Herpetosiphon giganteus]MBM7845759.1 hypothetical protein [Herpetosiphon giganteus]